MNQAKYVLNWKTKLPIFHLDHNMFKATDVEDLLKIADYGEDDSNSENSSDLPPVVEEQQPFVNLVKSSDVLGINREAIMNQVSILFVLPIL